ncbi:MAG: P-loop NTPase fold protein [Roseitalea porphyridii]|uniref:KAP family P-loop NTPase fold protein n=1 Tax=Roseitalea porphyridii TaxID=1852022 RepID=UPI0032D991C0
MAEDSTALLKTNELDIWQDDRLNREEDGSFLIQYMLDRSARAGEDSGLAINLNAPWGFGKTFFLKRLQADLQRAEHRVAMVDAWRDDHAEDPLFAVMSGVFAAFEEDKGASKRIISELKNNAGKLTVRMARGAITRVLEAVIGKKDAEGVIDDFGRIVAGAVDDVAGEYAEAALASFDKGRQAISDFRDGIAQLVGTLDKPPLFILIDELDRCRPTYAVALLERLKHMFDMPGVVFVVATDTGQLVHTVKAVYGADFDAQRYLMRFFDRAYQFGEPPLEEFVESVWKRIGLDDERFMTLATNSNKQEIATCARAMRLSLRDIEQCLELLYSVSLLLDERLRLPTIYAFVMCTAFHSYPEDFSEMAEHGFLFRGNLKLADHLKAESIFCGWDHSDHSYHGREVNEQLLEVVRRFADGLATPLSRTNEIGSSWAKEYYDHEFAVLHNNRYNSGSPPQSILNGLPDAIRRAARMHEPG